MTQENGGATLKGSREQLQEKIIADYARLGLDDTFSFACHPGVPCFNHCCADVNVFLSPYDVLRLRKRLGLESGEFLDRYALMPIQKDMKTPVVMLRMNEDETKTCPLLTPEGCGIYSDRPWPCRMYPLGMASPGDVIGEKEFYFLLREDVCKGFDTGKEWTVREWMEDQEATVYNELGEEYKAIALHPRIQQGKPLGPKQLDMFFMACYDLDKFRRFLFETSFFDNFDIDPQTVETLKEDDVALLRFGFRWLRFCIFEERTLKVRDEVIKAKQEQFT